MPTLKRQPILKKRWKLRRYTTYITSPYYFAENRYLENAFERFACHFIPYGLSAWVMPDEFKVNLF